MFWLEVALVSGVTWHRWRKDHWLGFYSGDSVLCSGCDIITLFAKKFIVWVGFRGRNVFLSKLTSLYRGIWWWRIENAACHKIMQRIRRWSHGYPRWRMAFAPVGLSPWRMDVKAPRVKELVLENRQITIRDLSNSLKLSIGTEQSTVREELGCKIPYCEPDLYRVWIL
jgi:hypothetical protein